MKAKQKEVTICNGKGEIIGTISSSMDINELKKKLETLIAEKEKAEKQARKNFHQLEQIIACMPGSVFWKDKNGAYQGCNDTLLKLLDLPRSEVIGKTDYDFGKKLGWDAKVAEVFTQVDQEVIRTGIARLNVEESPFHFADGKLIYQLSNKVPLRNEEGEIIGIVGISIDITELKTTQALLKKEKNAQNL